jgi:hypothetical protein
MATGVLVRALAGKGWRDVWRQRATWLAGWPAPTYVPAPSAPVSGPPARVSSDG